MKCFPIVLFLLFFQYHFAQSTDTKIFNSNNGLISNYVSKVFVDSKDDLWVGTRAGLAKKVMNRFEQEPNSILYKFNNIFDILEDDKNGMWIAGYGQGVLYLHNNQSKLIDIKSGLINNRVRTLYSTGGKIYAGTQNGVSIISTKDLSIKNPKFIQDKSYFFEVSSFFSNAEKVYATTINDGIYEVTDKELIKVSDIKKIFSSFVSESSVLLGTADGLLQVDQSSFKIIKNYPLLNVLAFEKIGDAVFLTASGFFDTGGGLYELNGAKIVNRTSELGIKENDLKTVAYHKTNQFIYLGTKQNGIFQININPPVRHQKDLGTVYCLNTQDQKQFVFHNQGFSIFSEHEVIKHISLAKFKKFQKENYQRFADKTTIKEHFYPIDYDTPSDKIKFYQSLLYKNEIWVSSNIGMFELSLSGEILSYHPVHVYSFTFFKDKLVTAVPYAGVRIFHNIYKMDYSYFHDWGNNKIPTEVVAITQTDEAVYFATALNGVYEFKDNKFLSWTLEGSFDEKKIKRIVAFNQYELIVVTDFNDVFILNTKFSKPKIIKHFSHQMIKGSSTNFVNSIKDVIYIGTNEGINVFYNKKCFFIDQEQGLTNTNSYSAVSGKEHLYLGTSEGFFELSNDYFVKKREDNTRVILSKIKVNNVLKEINTSQIAAPKLNLPYNQNNVIIDFIAQHNKYPNKLHFKYRLKKSEPWIDIFDENRLNLNYLKDDIYNIQILVTNLDTGLVQIQNLVELTINPPFYATWIFTLGCLVFLSIVIIFIYKLRITYLKRRQVEELNMIKLQNEQEKIQLLFDKQLSDVKLQALQSQMNSHFLFNVLSSIQYYIICKDIDQALYYLERFAVLIRTTLDYSERKEISLSQEIEYLQHYIEIENIRVEYSIVFSIIVSPKINLDEIFITPMLLQPFVENAIVHGFTSTIIKPVITLEIQQLTDSVRLILSDNGIGYQVKKNKTHQSKGISIIQKRLDLSKKNLQNSLKIDTSIDGTVVTIEI